MPRDDRVNLIKRVAGTRAAVAVESAARLRGAGFGVRGVSQSATDSSGVEWFRPGYHGFTGEHAQWRVYEQGGSA